MAANEQLRARLAGVHAVQSLGQEERQAVASALAAAPPPLTAQAQPVCAAALPPALASSAVPAASLPPPPALARPPPPLSSSASLGVLPASLSSAALPPPPLLSSSSLAAIPAPLVANSCLPPPLAAGAGGAAGGGAGGAGGAAGGAGTSLPSSGLLPPPPAVRNQPEEQAEEEEEEAEGEEGEDGEEGEAEAGVEESADLPVSPVSALPPPPASIASSAPRPSLRDLSSGRASSKQTVKYEEVGSQVHYHTATGNWEVVEELLSSCPSSLACRSNDGRTILHVAASLGYERMAEGILRLGMDVDAVMDNGITSLMLAVAKGQAKVVSLLLSSRASLACVSLKDGYSALHLAAMHRQLQPASLLLSHAQQPEKTKLLELPSKRGYRPLHLATVETDTEMVDLLLQHGADVDATTALGWTVLHFAAHVGSLELCRLFVTRSPLLAKAKNQAGNRPLATALAKGNTYLAEVLDPKVAKSAKKEEKKKAKAEKKEERTAKKAEKKEKKEGKDGAFPPPSSDLRPPPPRVLQFFERPDYVGNDGQGSLLERMERDPSLLAAIQEDPAAFLRYLPPDMQDVLLREAEDNPALMAELMAMGKEVLVDLIENHPDQLLGSLKNPLKLFKGARTPKQLMKLVRELEENPMMVLDQQYQENPEAFLLKQLRDNPRLLFLVVEKVKEKKPHLLPLVRVLIGMSEEEQERGMEVEKKGVMGKAKNKLWKATAAKMVKKLLTMDDDSLEKLELPGVDMRKHAGSIRQFRDFVNTPGGAQPDGSTMGPLFTIIEEDDDQDDVQDGKTQVAGQLQAVLAARQASQPAGIAIEAPD